MPGVPRLLFRLDRPGFIALGETFLTGVPLGTLLGRHNYRELALKATRWLADLAGQATPLPRATWWHRLVESVLVDFDASFDPVVDPAMLRETRAILATLGDMPIVCEQRDFSPWNILLTPDGSLAVLDWESAELQGLPGMDLIYFLSYLAFFLDGAMESGHCRGSYRTAMNPSTLTGSVTQECLSLYCDQLGLEPGALNPIRLLVWLLHSRSEYQHMTADAGGRPGPEVLGHSLFVRLWKEELRHYANKAW
jgi:hypothetical protein